MKKTILAMILMVGATTFSYAQCQKNYTLSGVKTEYLDGSGTVQRVVEEKSQLVVEKDQITVTHGEGDGDPASGPFKYESCTWKDAFKNGKSVLKSTLVNQNGQSTPVTLTIEGKDGKITLLVQLDDSPDRQIRVTVDKFEEKK